MYTIFVFLSALPFFPFIIVWIAGSYWVRPKKKSVHAGDGRDDILPYRIGWGPL